MDFMIIVFVGTLCMYVGVKILYSEERNKVFNKRPIEVVDVKKYNQYCGWLTIGFGAVAVLTLYIGSIMGGWVSGLFTLALIGEAGVVLFLYNKIEAKMLKKRNQKKTDKTEKKE